MKKKLVISVMLVMLLCMVGCGAETTDAEVETVTETVAETVEETIVEESEVVEVEETTEEVVVEISREDMAMEKINKLKDAYYDLINSKDIVAVSSQFFIELKGVPVESPDFLLEKAKTSNGHSSNSSCLYASTGSYYYDYVNNDNGIYDFSEWFAKYENIESIFADFFGTADVDYINSEIFKSDEETGYETENFITMATAAANMPYMVSFDEITLGECVETTEYKICGIDSAYIYPIYFDGKDIGSFAIFDANDNLLNIYYPDEFKSGVSTWPGEDVTIYTIIPELAETVKEETTEVSTEE